MGPKSSSVSVFLVVFAAMSGVAEAELCGNDSESGTPPYFVNLPGAVHIPHTSEPGVKVYTIRVNDADEPHGTTNITVLMKINLQFTFDSSTLELHTGKLTNLGGAQRLYFSAIDTRRNTATSTLLVYFQNDPPEFHGTPKSTYFTEDTTSQRLLFTVNVTDTVDEIRTCTWYDKASIASPFVVRLIPETQVYGIYNKPGPNFDFQTEDRYDLIVKCYDGGVWGISGQYHVFITKNKAPVITNLQNSTIATRDMCKGDDLFTVMAFDPEGGYLSYSLQCEPSNCPFRIFNSGVIKLTMNLRVDLSEGYELTINAFDRNQNTVHEILTVTFADGVRPGSNRTCPSDGDYASVSGDNDNEADEGDSLLIVTIILGCAVGLLLLVVIILVVYIVVRLRKEKDPTAKPKEPFYLTPYTDPTPCIDHDAINMSEACSDSSH